MEYVRFVGCAENAILEDAILERRGCTNAPEGMKSVARVWRA